MPAGDVHGDALDPGAERRLPHARPHDCAHAARFRVHRCQDVQVTTSGSASVGSASAVGNHSTVRRPATAALTAGSLSDVGGWRSVAVLPDVSGLAGEAVLHGFDLARLDRRRQEKAAAAVANEAERVTFLKKRERQRREREEAAERRLREEAASDASRSGTA